MPAIEIEKKNIVVLVYLYVVSVEIGVTYAGAVKTLDARTDRAPEFLTRRVAEEPVGERSNCGLADGQQIGRVKERSNAPVASGGGTWDRQSLFVQTRKQAPFAECTRPLLTQPEIKVTIDTARKAAAPIMSKDKFMPPVAYEQGRSASTRTQRASHRL